MYIDPLTTFAFVFFPGFQAAKRERDLENARRYSESAKKLLIATIVVGVIVIVISVVLRFVLASTYSQTYDPYN